MTQSSEAPVPYELILTSDLFAQFEGAARDNFNTDVSSLTYEQVAALVGGFVIAASQSAIEGEFTRDGHTVNAVQDGVGALEGIAERTARSMAPQIDDDRDYIVSEARRRSLWEVIRDRTAEDVVVQSYRFRNDPPQYA